MMKHVCLTLSLIIIVSCTSVQKPLMVYSCKPATVQYVHLSTQDGIIAAPEPSIAFTDDFSNGLGAKWQAPLNSSDIVTFKTGEIDGKPSMVWINEKTEDKDYDTETAIGTKPFSVAGFHEIRLKYQAKSTVGKVLRSMIIQYKDYDFKLKWYKKGEKEAFHEDFFDCQTSPETFIPNKHIFAVPEQADTATLHYGFGKPNFQKGQYFAITDLLVTGYGRDTTISKHSSIETVPILLTGTDFLADATAPVGSSIKFSFAYAPDDGGMPGAWSAWSEATLAKIGTLFPPQNASWVKCKVDFTSNGNAAASIKSIKLGRRIVGNWKSIIEDEAPDANIISPSPAKPNDAVTIKIDTTSEINWKASDILVDDKSAKGLFRPLPAEGDGVFQYSPTEPFAHGLHKVTFKLTTLGGATMERRSSFYVGEKRTSSPQVTLRYDGMIIVDGKPFFPIGLYYLKKYKGNNYNFDTMFEDLRNRGFNFGREAGCFEKLEDAREFAEAAARHDFKVFLSASFQGANTQDVSAILECITSLQDCKSILMWYIGDDTSIHNTVESLRYKSDIVNAVDPMRLTVFSDGVGDKSNSIYRRHVNCSEVFQPQIYPLRNFEHQKQHDECVFNTIDDIDVCTRDIRDKATGPRGLHTINQFFCSSKPTRAPDYLFPDPGEVRAMTYASIIRGVTGITFYRYGYNSTFIGAVSYPDRWEELSGVARELDSLMDILTAEPIPQPAAPVIIKGDAVDKKGRVPIYALLKRSDKRTVLMTVNASINDVTAKIALPGITSVKELFPTKDYPLAAPGVLEIPFTRHQVRVFEVK
ncbi:MAG: hypothetical protein J6X55_11995 [Victivallales bacterium]|nr:hypothetical protein [Victivallales bacterium]